MRYENSYDPTGMRQLQPLSSTVRRKGYFPKLLPVSSRVAAGERLHLRVT